MGGKKFIDKKHSATFRLFACDSSSSSSAADRVFVRVDDNPFPAHGFLGDPDDDGRRGFGGGGDGDSIFDDAPGDASDEEPDGRSANSPWTSRGAAAASRASREGALPEHVRREILELGLPDDGYNYLAHLREIKDAGGGSAYFHNPRATLDSMPLDVKAYDASRLRICADDVDDNSKADSSIYAVASRTATVRVQKAVDPDVVKLLEDSDLSRFGSDVEDLEEDFVIKANCPEAGEEEEVRDGELFKHDEILGSDTGFGSDNEEEADLEADSKPRVRRLIDEQFDMLTIREYDDNDDDGAGFSTAEPEHLVDKLKIEHKEYPAEYFKLEERYRAPADFVCGQQESCAAVEEDVSADVIRRCVQYAERYLNESKDDEEVVYAQESSDESEVWDCETIISTYSNLDNHPGKIQAPENPKNRLSKVFSGEAAPKHDLIALRGKEMLPLQYLPQRKKSVGSLKKPRTPVSSDPEKLKRKNHREESTEEKKERKATVKEERREARRAKKELKDLYKCETQRAQKVAAISGPSSIHLM